MRTIVRFGSALLACLLVAALAWHWQRQRAEGLSTVSGDSGSIRAAEQAPSAPVVPPDGARIDFERVAPAASRLDTAASPASLPADAAPPDFDARGTLASAVAVAAPRREAAQTSSPAPALTDFSFRFVPAFTEQLRVALASTPARLHVPVTDGRDIELIVTNHEPGPGSSGVVVARVGEGQAGHAVLSYVDDAVAGTIVTAAGELYQVRYAGAGVQRVVQLDPSQFPEEAESLVPPLSVAGRGGVDLIAGRRPLSLIDLTGDGAEGSEATGDLNTSPVVTGAPPMMSDVPVLMSHKDGTNTIIDLLVVYTPQSRSNNGGIPGIDALIAASVASANVAFSNSNIGIRLRLVYTGEVSYTSTASLSTDLSRLQNPSDGYMDDVYALRAQYNADLVSLFVPPSNDGAAGIGYLVNPMTQGSGAYSYAFTTVVDMYADSNLTLAHEIGHNLGASHAQGDSQGGGIFSNSYGYRFTVGGTTYRTVMAYAPGIRIPYFSNPAITYLGVPVGSSQANNAATLVQTKGPMASSRTGTADWMTAVAADFNADGSPDLVWRHALTRRSIMWTMNGVARAATPTIYPADSGDTYWFPLASGDYNFDGKPDIVWRNSTSGRVIAWFMDGATRLGTAPIWPATNPGESDWVPMADGDFNGDGQSDLVWRNSSTGRVIAWFMSGVTRTGTAPIWPATNPGDADWMPMASADFNGDTKPDLIWRNSSTGRVIVWFMDGTTRTGTAALWAATNPGESAWRPIATGDFNADGQADIVWRNVDTGRVIVWFMNGTSCIGTATIWG